jgi:phosphonoacetaldehyde hydrolase
MHYQYNRRYCGTVQAVILDWAGTTVDFGCLAPAEAFTHLFADEGVTISNAQAREPMGTEKREHIRRVLQIPAVAAEWLRVKGAAHSEADVDRLYVLLEPIQIAAIERNANLIPGFDETLTYLGEERIRIGANTGYNRKMLEVLQAATASAYRPLVSLASEDAPRGRPYPDLALIAAVKLGVENVAACVKVDDTVPGVEEGLNAGMWSVGVALSGNECGLSKADLDALDEASFRSVQQHAHRRLRQAGAHYVIDTIAELPEVIEDINARLAAGEAP